MASHRRPKAPGRARITVLTAAAATTVALSATAAQSAQAAPTQTTAQLKAQIDKLNTDADTAVQQYDKAQSDQQALQKQVSTLQDQVARQQASVTAKATALGSVASAQYRSGSIDPSVQLMLASDPSTYLNQASAQSQITASQSNMLAELKGEQSTLNNEKAQAESKLKALDATSKQLAASKAAVQQKLAAAQAKLDSLTSAQAAALKAANATSAAKAAASVSSSSSSSSSASGSSSSKAGDSVEATAYAAAQTKLGDAYVYGATGPNTFDCSGLTQWAFAQAGVAIGRTTYDQINAGTAVSRANLQVGDLVFFNNDSHVAIYAGNNMVLHAPHTGTVVKYESIDTIGSIYAMRHI
ncbi:cell wall-associated NlpC family hydrolase [Streptomyces sp. 846.5]|nr:cell wall-associated NlpC family hydrolase [Streptomyces sp. 846.5]